MLSNKKFCKETKKLNGIFSGTTFEKIFFLRKSRNYDDTVQLNVLGQIDDDTLAPSRTQRYYDSSSLEFGFPVL